MLLACNSGCGLHRMFTHKKACGQACGSCGDACDGDLCGKCRNGLFGHRGRNQYVPSGPPAAHVTYPYYTTRGPRDYFSCDGYPHN